MRGLKKTLNVQRSTLKSEKNSATDEHRFTQIKSLQSIGERLRKAT